MIEGEGDAALVIMKEARNKGGRPSGTPKKRKRMISLALIAAKNQIASIYAKIHEKAREANEKNELTNFICDVKARNDIPADIEIKHSTNQ